MKKLFAKTYNKSKKEYVKLLEDCLKESKKKFVVTANPEAFMLAMNDEAYSKMLMDTMTDIVPDGIGLVKAGQMLDFAFEERIPGVDLAEELLLLSNVYHKKVFLFGSKKEVIEKMRDVILEKYPNCIICGLYDGYVDDKEAVFKEMAKQQPDVVLVALGMPLQEQLIYKCLNLFKKGIFVGVGGSFDVLSGMKKRAPKIFIKLNLEWLYRIACEPKRLKRFYDNNVKFIFKIRKYKKMEAKKK